RCGLTFIGPSPESMQMWGDKVQAREAARKYGLPLLPGTDALESPSMAESEAGRIGYPVILKARAGGGGRGMRVVRGPEDLRQAYAAASSEAGGAFGNPELFLERFVEKPKHIEFQALGDLHGQVWTLGERECSLQRRHQKLIEEAPSPALGSERRDQMVTQIRRAIRDSG